MRGMIKFLFGGAVVLLLSFALAELDKIKREMREMEDEMSSWHEDY